MPLSSLVIAAIRRNADEAGGIIMVSDPNVFGKVKRAETALCDEVERLQRRNSEAEQARAKTEAAYSEERTKNAQLRHDAALLACTVPGASWENFNMAVNRAEAAEAKQRELRAELDVAYIALRDLDTAPRLAVQRADAIRQRDLARTQVRELRLAIAGIGDSVDEALGDGE